MKSASACGNPAKFVWKGEFMSDTDESPDVPDFQEVIKQQQNELLALKEQLPKSVEELKKKLKKAYEQGQYDFNLKTPEVNGSWRYKVLDKEGNEVMTVFMGEINHPNPNNKESLKGKYTLESHNFADKTDTTYKMETFEDPDELLKKINEYFRVYLENK